VRKGNPVKKSNRVKSSLVANREKKFIPKSKAFETHVKFSMSLVSSSIAITIISSIGIFGNYILFADGSYMTGMISQNKNFFLTLLNGIEVQVM